MASLPDKHAMNESASNGNSTNSADEDPYPFIGVFIFCTYILGIAGNLHALVILFKERKDGKYRNKKHLLMLRCLAGNDLVGLLGMLTQMASGRYITDNVIECGFRVVWRGFGLTSGCVALVMAVERWFALNHPFQYHKCVTYNSLLKAILICWVVVFLVTCMPFFGFGQYYDPVNMKCLRYRGAKDPVNIAYAYVFFAFGLLLSTSIVWANLAVSREMCHSRSRSTDSGSVGRRILPVLRSSSRSSNGQRVRVQCLEAATPDELAFGRLMIVLSVTFVLCWLPNLIGILLAQSLKKSLLLSLYHRLADALMALHFTLDPYIYVLLHHHFPAGLIVLFETLERHSCCWRSEKTVSLDETDTSFV